LGFDDAPSGPAVGAEDADEMCHLATQMRSTSIQEQDSRSRRSKYGRMRPLGPVQTSSFKPTRQQRQQRSA
jgi:hypothetical protein